MLIFQFAMLVYQRVPSDDTGRISRRVQDLYPTRDSTCSSGGRARAQQGLVNLPKSWVMLPIPFIMIS